MLFETGTGLRGFLVVRCGLHGDLVFFLVQYLLILWPKLGHKMLLPIVNPCKLDELIVTYWLLVGLPGSKSKCILLHVTQFH